MALYFKTHFIVILGRFIRTLLCIASRESEVNFNSALVLAHMIITILLIYKAIDRNAIAVLVMSFLGYGCNYTLFKG